MDEQSCTRLFSFMDPQKEQFDEPADAVIDVADILKIKKNITYIVCGLIFRETNNNHEILMMQEARKDCNGAWYLPAGRLEPGETLEEGMMREVVEETGIVCKSDGLITVETVEQSCWFRFTFLASEIGGKLKTVADEESLKAQWYPVNDVLNRKIHLRGKDILKLIEIGLDGYRKTEKKLALTIDRPFSKLLCRLCIIHTVNDRTLLLVRKVEEHYKLPIVEFSQKIWFGVCINTMCQLFTGNVSVKPSACVSLESCPKPAYEHDGFLITVLCSVKPEHEEAIGLTEQALTSGYSLEQCDNLVILENILLWSKFGCKLF